MPTGFEYQRKSFQASPGVTGGAPTKSGDMANSSSFMGNLSNIRQKSKSLNEIPILGHELAGQIEAAGFQAESQVAQASIQSALAQSEANAQAAIMAKEAQIAEQQAAQQAEQAAAASRQSGSFGLIKGVVSAGLGLLSLSDERSKNTITELPTGLDFIRKLNPVSFYYNKEYSVDPGRLHYGFIAQEYQEVLPDATYQETTTGLSCIDTNEVIALLVKANQELESRIERLEATAK